VTVGSCEGRTEAISALIDGELARDEELELRRHLEACEICTAWLVQLEAYSVGLARTMGKERAPRNLGERIRGLAPRRRWPLRMAVAIAAAVAIASVWTLEVCRATDPFDSALVADHLRMVSGAEPLEVVSSDPAEVALALSERLPFRVEFAQVAGVRLRGGHACRIEGRSAACLQFDDEGTGERVSVFVYPSTNSRTELAPRCRSLSGHNLCSWERSGQSITAVATTPDAAQRFADSALGEVRPFGIWPVRESLEVPSRSLRHEE
jgi:anti-sigma factor RsiW